MRGGRRRVLLLLLLVLLLLVCRCLVAHALLLAAHSACARSQL
jgi:hypothetical protein